MKITNAQAKPILARFIRSCTWLQYYAQHQPMLDPSLTAKTYHFLATLNQQSKTTWDALSQQEQDNIRCAISTLFSQLSNEFYHQNCWFINEEQPEQTQAMTLLQQIFAVSD
ncbi:hypothetical protein [Gallibacterium anatis]|uniref:Uncharacterized protein n=1 Tax=Gallibacterium anatis 4895 TaxID=1396510 RepID=A0A0A2ZR68_9PAST|nr:hypothetical protein [Gallibacterium anatis]KGQ57947.1 hypothetical protein IO48_12855 [Gallibacterium anatis 4895]